ncbi:hypothetical protein [Sphingomonas hankyongi]|uniref:DUF4124 domain-containing protein n=1 Tax=Sphingomonas hankyongi TaxID=2908209 RepID=A0ABT0S268_9SPHN|nr:hypothetical protein [Sphingomonas hankyongi]MCL6729959.1 hypothetical protein [Sphingomonas hankyongi]
MKYGLAAAVAFLSSVASAQTTTTNCTTYYWGSTQCVSQTPQQSSGVNWGLINNQQTPNAGQSFMDAYQRGLRDRAAREAAQQQAQAAAAETAAAEAQARAVDAARQADELHKAQSLEAAKLVTAGDCAGAQQYALSVGNFVLAQQVKDYCAK